MADPSFVKSASMLLAALTISRPRSDPEFKSLIKMISEKHGRLLADIIKNADAAYSA